ncbi:hypothetical protein PV379_00380 [Streptomyces caniscabiei]|uniref:hypothetical protein n=1 Tax=Streptomyces caniscabiei TaxID=2746961 RepID=UPI0029A96F9E|nr:hypothetical protein [Streptomyces caniscabiei]MDX2775812.1 hypothetical protein [Streptomyces caniscabiei]
MANEDAPGKIEKERLSRYEEAATKEGDGIFLSWLVRVPSQDGKSSKRWIKWYSYKSEADQISEFYLYDKITQTNLKTIPADAREVSLDGVDIGTSLSIHTHYKSGETVPGNTIINAPESSFASPGVPPPKPEDLEWYNALTQSEKDMLNNDNVMTDWLKTTARYDSRLIEVFEQNDTTEWRDDNNKILFHGDEQARPPEDIFPSGLAPYNPLAASMEFNKPAAVTALECMSYNAYIAHEYSDMVSAAAGNPYSYIYITDAPRGVNVPTWDYSESEIDYPGGVGPDYVMGCFVCKNPIGNALPPVSYAPNPNALFYKNGGDFGNAPDGMVDILISTSTKLQNIILSLYDTEGHVVHINQQITRIQAKGSYKMTARLNNSDTDLTGKYWYKNFTFIPSSDSSASAFPINLDTDPFTITGSDNQQHKILLITVSDPYQ